MSQERIEREKELEMLAVQMRDERIELDVERSGLSGTAGGKSLIKRTLSETEGSCVEALTEWKQAEEAKRRRSNAYKYLALLDNETLTYITARSLINALAKKSPAYRQTIDNLADEVMAAGAAHLYKMKDTDAFKSLTRRLNWQEKLYVRKRIANEEFRNECIELTPTIQEKLAVGATLCEIFCRTTGLFEVKTIWVRKQESRKELAITPMGQKWVQDAFNTNRMANPLHLPMVIKPYPWTTLYDGGYLYQNLHPATLVRTKSGSIHPSIKEADLTQVMDAVNAIQETAWQINKPVLDVWRQLVGTGLAGCSDGESMPIPEALDKEDPEYAERQTARRECFEYNKDNTAKRCVEIQKLRMAEILENEAEIYFPHNLDFRGRIYPLAGRGAINPQGDDSGKALLRFASGKRLGAEGVPWLFIHTQNTLGNDKVSLQRRVSATEENIGLYISYALDPLNNVGWMEADKPFCFLACCFELLGYSIEGEDYVSHLPIAIDGSCSGLQHFAIGR
jgi:DNA-directed RNA polymerase